VTLGALTLLLLRRPRPHLDAAARLYAHFQRTLARQGFVVRPQEGPCTLLQRIEQAYPAAAADARRIIELYIAMRYSAAPDAAMLPELRRAVNTFKPR
jgi:hypothetical protein